MLEKLIQAVSNFVFGNRNVLLAVFGVAGLAVVGALIAVLAVVALAASPVLLGLALIWWLLRSARKAPTAADPSTLTRK